VAYGRLVWAAEHVCPLADSSEHSLRVSAAPCVIQAVSRRSTHRFVSTERVCAVAAIISAAPLTNDLGAPDRTSVGRFDVTGTVALRSILNLLVNLSDINFQSADQ